MTQRHIIFPHAVYFVSTVVRGRMPIFNASTAPKFLKALGRAKAKHFFRLFAFAVMPDHVHLLIQPRPPETISSIMLAVKRSTAFEIGRGPIWQLRFHDHIIRDERDFNNHVAYVHRNPVKHNIVRNSADYRWTSLNPEFSDLLSKIVF